MGVDNIEPFPTETAIELQERSYVPERTDLSFHRDGSDRDTLFPDFLDSTPGGTHSNHLVSLSLQGLDLILQ